MSLLFLTLILQRQSSNIEENSMQLNLKTFNVMINVILAYHYFGIVTISLLSPFLSQEFIFQKAARLNLFNQNLLIDSLLISHNVI